MVAVKFLATLALQSALFSAPMLPNNIDGSTLLTAGFLPERSWYYSNTGVNIPKAITTLHPLPQEELMLDYSRGMSYLMEGEFENAVSMFSKGLDIRPDIKDLYLNRGIAYEKLLRWDDAINDYRTVINMMKSTINPFSRGDPVVYNNLANAELGKGLYEDALRDFTYSASISDKEFIAPQLGRNLILFQIGKADEAEAFFQLLVTKYPNFADGLAALAGMSYDPEVQSTAATAKQYFERAVEQDSRYYDLEWVEDIRRFPPKLVANLRSLKSSL